jgi:hypothetical protein
MNEAARKQRNQQRLTECFPTFSERVKAVIADMENQGFRPRIQDAHRTIEDQLIAFNTGKSDVKFGFHNVTGANGKPEALAVDLLDDDNPLAPKREYEIRLAATAQKNGLQSGIFFRLDESLRSRLRKAIAELNFDSSIEIGFDPTHIEVTGILIAEAKAGRRPG